MTFCTTLRTQRNVLSWLLVCSLTILFSLLIYLGPDTHSEIGEEPSQIGNLVKIFSFFFILGAVFLPVTGPFKVIRLNRFVTLIGSLILLVRLMVVLINMPGNFSAPGVIVGWLMLLFAIAVLVLLAYKLKAVWKDRVN